jgi:CNT family concentrative nucleoside transporter
MHNFSGVFGILVILGLALLLSVDRKKIKIRIIIWGLSLQLFFSLIILKIPFIKDQFLHVDLFFKKLISFSDAGSNFLFESFIPGIGYHSALVNFAFRALPIIIFFSSLISLLYHLGLTQKVIQFIAKIMQKTMRTSAPETLSVSANIFIGQTEAPILVRPYISKMTNSELATIMTGGFSTAAGSVLALYVTWLESIPGIAGHLLAASIMSAPASIVIAKIIFPEVNKTLFLDNINILELKKDGNIIDAIVRGASDGLKLAANVGAMLIAFVSIIAMINYVFSLIFNQTLQESMGIILSPLAWSMGIPWKEANIVGTLMSEKIVLTELIAYSNLSEIIKDGLISERSAIISSYALCGFANFSSIGIQLGGLNTIAPERKKDLSKVVFKAMIGGALASFLTATLAGILI